MHKALEQARAGRMHILGVMNETMDAPRGDLSPFAPRLTTIKIPVEFIGAVIGPGGEMIRAITKETNSEINIEDDGTITIAAVKGEHAQAAIEWIMGLIRMPEVGTVYQAKVKEVREGLGAIMEFLPKKQGLLHISQIAHERVETVGDFMKAGDIVEVKLIEVQHDGKFRLSRKALLPRPEGMPEEEERPRRERPQGDRPRGGDRGYDRRGPRRN
jgi:polyribonucleotide nucleotidyltransferase